MRPILAVLSVLLAPAAAASGEFSLELGRLHCPDPGYDMFATADGIGSWGVRGGYPVTDNLSVIAGVHHGDVGADLYTMNGPEETFVMRSSLASNLYSAGLKAELLVLPFLAPYATVQGLAYHGVMRFDDDPNDRRSPGQAKQAGLGAGGMVTAGIEGRMPQKHLPVTVAVHLESGYALVSNTRFGSVGSLQPGGWVMRGGIGLRF